MSETLAFEMSLNLFATVARGFTFSSKEASRRSPTLRYSTTFSEKRSALDFSSTTGAGSSTVSTTSVVVGSSTVSTTSVGAASSTVSTTSVGAASSTVSTTSVGAASSTVSTTTEGAA